jgi:hypothetical protein
MSYDKAVEALGGTGYVETNKSENINNTNVTPNTFFFLKK